MSHALAQASQELGGGGHSPLCVPSSSQGLAKVGRCLGRRGAAQGWGVFGSGVTRWGVSVSHVAGSWVTGPGVRWSEVIGEGSASVLIDSSVMERSCKRVEGWRHEASL